MNDDLTRDDVLRTADRLVEELLSTAGVTRPPVNAIDLARHLGMTVRMEAPPGRRARVGDALLLSPEGSEESRQWTAAQAVGERLKGDLLRRLGIDPAARPGLPGESLPALLAQSSVDADLLVRGRRAAAAAGTCRN